MATYKLPLSSKLLEIRDIVGFSADYLMQAFQHLDNTREQHIIFTICSNLYRAEHCLELEIKDLGLEVENKAYNPYAFTDVDFLNINIVRVIEEFIETKKGTGELELLRKIL